ncbi:MAG: O-antigen ligase family protein [Anaerolineales bacterium]|nr:O-antigen ligase family protein [Anaerolineales bacterium]
MRRLFLASLILLAAVLSGLAAVAHQQATRTFGVVDGLPPADLDARPANLRAINVALEAYAPADLERALAPLTGFGWLRQTFRWPAGQTPDWPAWDRLISAAASRGFRLIAVLAEPQPAAPPAPEAFAEFAGAFAARYAGQIHAYQVWDEPNLGAAWGGSPSAAQYLAVLQAAYGALHAADPQAWVLAAGLAPTVEAGPDNISDLLYLQQLYDLGAAPYFDAAAGKPYGFTTGPDDRQAGADLLNFSRFGLLRQVMERNGDGHKLLWGSNFGWNARASPWGQVTPEQQAAYTQRAYQRAEQEWPWAGPLSLETGRPDLPEADPRWGFALFDPAGAPTALGRAIAAAPAPAAAQPGNAGVDHPAAVFTGAWQFSDLGADIPEAYAGARLVITFQGSDLALRVRRGDYRAYLYVTVDGRPANRLPQDARGAYLVLTAPDLKPRVDVVSVAAGLDPDAIHTAVIEPERGWGQWALAGFTVGRRIPAGDYGWAAALLGVAGGLALAGLVYAGRRLALGLIGAAVSAAWRRLGELGQLAVTAAAGLLLFVSAWWTFEGEAAGLTRRLGDTAPVLLTALSAGLFYFSPSAIVALLALAALFVLFCLRLDLALAFIAAFIPFFLFPRLLWERGASVLEFCVWLALGAWLVRGLRPALRHLRAHGLRAGALVRGWSGLDWGVLALVTVAGLSTLAAARRDVAFYEFRTVIVLPALYYLLVRVTPLDQRGLWRIVDFFLAGAVAVAGIGLYQAVSGVGLILTEEGVARIRSVYGSPNNLALYLGRALPVALAVALAGWPMRQWPARRALYALASLVMGAALLLTFSRGALVLGLPAAAAVLLIGWQGRRGAVIVGAAGLLALAAVPVLAQLPRFAGLFNTQSGTGFFRINLWVSAWRMFVDHPWLGVGPDNFLYAYRGFYILPQAWQEPNLSHPHNVLMDFLSRLGLLGLGAGLWLITGLARQLWPLANPAAPAPLRALRLGLLALLADMLAHGLVDHSFFLVDLACAFMLALALAQRSRAEAV